jgi:Outer membrane protein beta-barrel domain
MKKMNMRLPITLCLLVLCATCLVAQGKIGFKTGLNFAQLKGDADTDNAGKEIDGWEPSTGFHIGVTYTYKFVDAFRVRGEFLFSRRSSEYKHVGQMHRTFFNSNTQFIQTRGTGQYLVKTSNAYFEIPVSAVFKYKKFEVSAGIYGGILAISSGQGALSYKGTTALGTTTDSLNIILDHNYFQDEVGGFTPGTAVLPNTLDGKAYNIAKTQGAYYNNSNTETEKLFNRLDAGVIAGAAYYFNSTLYLGGRLQYGLMDITNNAGHYSLSKLTTDGKSLLRNTKDTNFNLQFSVGFSF